MAIDHVAAALDALASWVGGLSGIAEGKRGWPEHREELDLSSGPVATWTQQGVTPHDCPPARIEELDSTTAGVTTVTYRVGRPVIRARLDLWVRHRAERDDAVQVIEANRDPAVPRPGLWLTSTGYFDRPLTVLFVRGPLYPDENDAAEVGEWRASWDVEIHTDRVVQTTHPQLTDLDLALSSETQGETSSSTIAIFSSD